MNPWYCSPGSGGGGGVGGNGGEGGSARPLWTFDEFWKVNDLASSSKYWSLSFTEHTKFKLLKPSWTEFQKKWTCVMLMICNAEAGSSLRFAKSLTSTKPDTKAANVNPQTKF